jgi:prolipoprotein diacylglyceryltransferase
MSIPSPPPEWAQFHLGPLTIHAYALCIIAGIIAATIITQRRLSRRGAEGRMFLHGSARGVAG